MENDCSPFPVTRKSGRGRLWGPSSINCSVVGCPSSTLSCPDLWFYMVPRQSNFLRQKWLEKIGRTEDGNVVRMVVCQKHFRPQDITGLYHSRRTNLKRGTLPEICLPSCSFESVFRFKPKPVYQKTGNIETTQNIKKMIKPHAEIQSTIKQENIRIGISDNESDITDYCSDLSNNNSDDMYNISNNSNTSDNNGNTSDNNDNNSDISGNNSDNISDSDKGSAQCSNQYSFDPKIGNEELDSLNKFYIHFKSKRESCNNVFSNEYKLKIFQLYYDNSQAYELLQSTLGLPPISTLPSYIPSTLDVINNFYLSSFRDKIGLMSLKDKHGVLCISMMSIQPYITYDYETDKLCGVWLGSKVAPLQHAVVAMIRGITYDWHHVVSILLLPSLDKFLEYSTFIEKLIMTVMEIGINIKAVVTGTEDLLRKVFHNKKGPYFCLKNYKIYHIFDPLHLMLLLYDELKHYDVHYGLGQIGRKVAKWEHIFRFYEYDTMRKYRLTDRSSSISPDELHYNKLKAAAEILSLRTAVNMSTFVEMKILEKKAMETVDFLVKVNSIFVTLYPVACHKDKEDKQTYNDSLWSENMKFFRCIKATSWIINTDQSKFPEYFLRSMESIAWLQKVPQLKKLRSELMHSLNVDPLTEFIHKIATKNFKRRYPTVNELFETLKNGFMENNFHNMKSKEEDDSKLENFIESLETLSEQSCSLENGSLKNKDIPQLDPEDANSLDYVATYLLDEMYKVHKNALSSRMKCMSSSISYENQCSRLCGSIIVPDNEFLEFVYKMDIIFVKYLPKAMGTGKLFEELMKELDKMFVTGPVDLAPLQYIKMLFLKLRIHQTIKYNNDNYDIDASANRPILTYRLSSQGLNLDK